MRPANILICENESAASREAADRFACAAVRSVAEQGRFCVAVSGGSTPKGMYESLAEEHLATVPWYRTELFFVDERCVPPDSLDSNYRMVHDLLLATVPIPETGIHRFEGELSPETAAGRYEQNIHAVMGRDPRFDLIVLGMGDDTHTASLFPYSPALNETGRLAVSNYVQKLATDRLTLTIPLINRAHSVIILVLGESKAQALADAMSGTEDIEMHPVQAVRPTHGRLLWIVDRAAAAKL
ncbi:MAG: 6-phosphogluconolactonase [Armatimonadetes bacterium]|nr:6-phosphogluconolactonase [Armatimonadota bacterium]